MKKITSLIVLLACLCLPGMAQSVLGDLDGHLLQVGTSQAKMVPGTWYFVSNPRANGNSGEHPDWFPVVGEGPVQGGLVYDNGNDVRLSSQEVLANMVFDGSASSNAAKYLVRFLETEKAGIYNVQFGTGNCMAGAPNQPTVNRYDAGEYAFYNTVHDGVATDGRFGWNVGNKNGARIDNNGAGYDVCTWGSGENTDVIGNNVWLIFDVVDAGFADPRTAAMEQLMEVLKQYEGYTFQAGTTPGTYDEEKVETFYKAISSAYEYGEDASKTADDLLALAQTIKDTYDAVIASRHSLAQNVQEGYYYLISAQEFTAQETTEDSYDEESGELIPGETITTHPTKAMYVSGMQANWNTINRDDANYLWKVVSAGDKTYHLINCQTEAEFVSVGKLGTENVQLMCFDWAGQEGMFNIRMAKDKEDSGAYFHANWHGGGTGTGADIVSWWSSWKDTPQGGPTEWIMEAVDEALALSIIEKNSPEKIRKQLVAKANQILGEAYPTIGIAKDQVTLSMDMEQPLINDAAQFNTTNNEDWEGSLADLIDGNVDTYWHSIWHNGDVGGGVHFLQVANIDAEVVAFTMERRRTGADHVVRMSVYGYDSDDVNASKGSGEWLAELSIPYVNNTTPYTSNGFATNGHKVLRFYSEETTHPARGYWHMSEFQLYPATLQNYYADGSTQAEQRAEQLAALTQAIKAWNSLNTETASVEDMTARYETLEQAWTNWTAVYINPTALREAMASAPSIEVLKIGDNPGEWKEASASEVLNGLVGAAMTYDKSGKYTAAETEQHMDALTSALDNLIAVANPVKEDVWYHIAYPSEEDFEQHDWEKKVGEASIVKEINAVSSASLFGKIAVVGHYSYEDMTYTKEDESEGHYRAYEIEVLNQGEYATKGATVHFMNKEDLTNDADLALWRFVAVGDSAYAIQNKATGLYIRTAGTSGQVTMDVHPALFQTKALGYGLNEIAARRLVDGASQSNLHAQRDINVLVTWGSTGAGTNTALYIEEVEPVTGDVDGEFTMSTWPGEVVTMCYPVDIEAKDGTLYSVSMEGTTVTLNPLPDNKAVAGQPVVYINGDTEDYATPVEDKEAEDYNGNLRELTTFVHGTDFVSQAGVSGALTGTFADINIGAGNIVAQKNGLWVTKKSSNAVKANTAYIAAGIEDVETEVTLVIGTESDAISEVLSQVSKSGNIYTVGGQMVGRGNLNSLKSMPRGMYIINGVKVMVK